MAVRDIQSELGRLNELIRSGPDNAVVQLRKALRDKVNLIVAKAAGVAAELQYPALISDLCAAFDRALFEPVKTDPQCWAKEAIAKALRDLGHAESAVFLRGVRHVQMEPVWGGMQDAAVALRGICALALLPCHDLPRDEKLWVMMRLLTESSPSLRKDAALALESLEGREAALMLRIKAGMGDEDVTVTGQILESLLRVEGPPAIPFVLDFINALDPEIREEAVLALGASRLGAAIQALQVLVSDKPAGVSHESLFRALSISRHENAIRFLVEVVANSRSRDAISALQALQLFPNAPEVKSEIANAVARRSEIELHRALQA